MKYCIVWAFTIISLRQDFFRLSLKLSIKKQNCNSYKGCAPTPLKRRRLALGQTLQVHMEKNPLHRLATTASNYLHFDIKHATNQLCVGTRCGLHLRVMLPLSWNTPLLYHQEKYDGNQMNIFHKLISIVSLKYLRFLLFMLNLTEVLCDSLSSAFPSLFLYCKAKSTIYCTASFFF